MTDGIKKKKIIKINSKMLRTRVISGTGDRYIIGITILSEDIHLIEFDSFLFNFFDSTNENKI